MRYLFLMIVIFMSSCEAFDDKEAKCSKKCEPTQGQLIFDGQTKEIGCFCKADEGWLKP